MLGFLLDIASAVLGAVIPIYRTWKVIKSRKSTQLVPLAKYWVVFGITHIVETLAGTLYIPYFLPGYSFIRFAAIVYICTSGYSHIYDSMVSPFLTEQEPLLGRFLTDGAQYSGQLTGKLIKSAVKYTLMTVSSNHGLNSAVYTSMFTASEMSSLIARESLLEVQEECEVIYPAEVKQEIMEDDEQPPVAATAIEPNVAGGSGDLQFPRPEMKPSKKQVVRRSSRTRKSSKK